VPAEPAEVPGQRDGGEDREERDGDEQADQILQRFADRAALEAMAVNDMMSALVYTGGGRA